MKCKMKFYSTSNFAHQDISTTHIHELKSKKFKKSQHSFLDPFIPQNKEKCHINFDFYIKKNLDFGLFFKKFSIHNKMDDIFRIKFQYECPESTTKLLCLLSMMKWSIK